MNGGALGVSDFAGLVAPAEGSNPDGLVEESLAAALDGGGGLEEEEGGELLLGQLLHGGGSQLAHVPLATVLLVHGGDSVEDELLTDGDSVHGSPLAPPGGRGGQTSQSSSSTDSSHNTANGSKRSCTDTETGDGSDATGGPGCSGRGARQGEEREGKARIDGASGEQGEHGRDLNIETKLIKGEELAPFALSHVAERRQISGSRKKSSFLMALLLRGGRGNGLTTRKINFFWSSKKFPQKCGN